MQSSGEVQSASFPYLFKIVFHSKSNKISRKNDCKFMKLSPASFMHNFDSRVRIRQEFIRKRHIIYNDNRFLYIAFPNYDQSALLPRS